jgi:competence protein ComK
LIMLGSYTINKQFMEMTGYYDRNGKFCTLVIETARTFIVDKSPLEIISDSIVCIGYDLRGATETAKKLLGNIYICPVLVNPNDRIVLFPTLSPKHIECVWFNPFHIKRTESLNRKTYIIYSNGQTRLIRAKLSSFNCKIKQAEQLEGMTKI